MARQISATALQSLLAQTADDVFLVTLEISHPDMAVPLRFVNNTEEITFAGQVFHPAAFTFKLPEDTEDNVPAGQVVLDNIDRQIIQVVRPLKTAPKIQVHVVLVTATAVTAELGPVDFKLKEFSYDAETISGRLGYEEDFLNEAFPKNTFNPRLTPGLF